MCHDWSWLRGGGIPETGRLPAGKGKGDAQWSQASMAYAYWGFCEHRQNMMQRRNTVAVLRLHWVSYILALPYGQRGSSYQFPTLHSTQCFSRFWMYKRATYNWAFPGHTVGAGIHFQGYDDYPGVLAKASFYVYSAETEKQMSERTCDLNRWDKTQGGEIELGHKQRELRVGRKQQVGSLTCLVKIANEECGEDRHTGAVEKRKHDRWRKKLNVDEEEGEGEKRQKPLFNGQKTEKVQTQA